jgi:hypothetical protein
VSHRSKKDGTNFIVRNIAALHMHGLDSIAPNSVETRVERIAGFSRISTSVLGYPVIIRSGLTFLYPVHYPVRLVSEFCYPVHYPVRLLPEFLTSGHYPDRLVSEFLIPGHYPVHPDNKAAG